MLQQHKPYKDAQCYGLQSDPDRFARNPCKIYVYCDFLKPGKH